MIYTQPGRLVRLALDGASRNEVRAVVLEPVAQIDGEPMIKLRWEGSGEYGAWVPVGWVLPLVRLID